MPLSDNSKFGVQALTTAVNKIDPAQAKSASWVFSNPNT